MLGTASGQVVADTVFFNVKDKPYIADTITITDRVLPDGNHIHHEALGKNCRDSEGRTRAETEATVPAGAEPFRMIHINDPVKEIMISLEDRHHTGIINHYNERNKSEPRKTAPVPTPPAVTPPTTVQLIRYQTTAQEDLGIQEIIQGILAEGVRYTTTIPAGAEHNREPIVLVGERWVAKDLMITVLTKNDDPRNGTREYRVTNIQRVEPDPALFEVPTDYQIKDISHEQR